MAKDPVFRYSGKDVDVCWDERLCIHIGECGRAAGDLFVGGRQPWCQPDLVATGDVVDVVQRCPTGALTFETKDGRVTEVPAPYNQVVVTYNGPLLIQGDLDIEGVPDDMPGVRYRAALCRCGHSGNKPFCDNSHEQANFRDYGAVGETGDGNTEEGGALAIKALPDGPLLLAGNLAITASSGRDAWRGKNAALCRCGASNNKPFCDGSHKRAGFKTD